MSVTCPECGKECKNGLGVAVHYSQQNDHPESPPDSVDTSDGVVPADFEHTEEAKEKMSKAASGENSWLYNIDLEDHPRYKPFDELESQSQRFNRIKRRDGYKCRICESEDDLEVHHIDGDNTNNSKTNLITLCNECHNEYTKVIPVPLPFNAFPDKYEFEARGETYVVKTKACQ